MEKASFEEFIARIRGSQSMFSDGYELGLIIDESNGSTDRVVRAVQTMSEETPTLCISIDTLLNPSDLKTRIACANAGEAVVFLTTEKPFSASHYASLQSIASSHALEEWSHDGTERKMIGLSNQNRFVLVVSRHVFQETLKTFPPIWDILGVSLSLDDVSYLEGK